MNDLLTMGGPEKEFLFRGKTLFLESEYHKDKEMIEMYLFEITEPTVPTISFWGKNFRECVNQFEQAPIFDGKTIYEIESPKKHKQRKASHFSLFSFLPEHKIQSYNVKKSMLQPLYHALLHRKGVAAPTFRKRIA